MAKNPAQYSSSKLEEFKAILDTDLNLTVKELDALKSNHKDQKKHLSSSNTDFNENSKHFQRQAKNKQLIRRLQRKARELKSALSRIDNKTYGVCDRSGALIREERLKAMPTARFDIQRK